MIKKRLRKRKRKALKALKRRRQEASPFSLIDVSSEETLSTGLLDPSSTMAITEARESSSHVKATLLDATKLLRMSIGFKSYSDSSKTFANFSKLISAKLDLFEIHNTREDRFFFYFLFFIFRFHHMVKVRILVFHSLFFHYHFNIFFLSNIYFFI